MKYKRIKQTSQSRNWPLVVIASLVILLNTVAVGVGIVYASTFGWWTLALVIGGISSITLAVIAIRKNDPVWLLLDLLLPN